MLSAFWKQRLHEIIFEADTRAGKHFDVALLGCIVTSVLVVMLESVPWVQRHYSPLLRSLEWCFTGLFTIEYLLRLMVLGRPWQYARSFYGIVDLLAILPSWLSLLFPGAQSLMVVRGFRLLRMFRVLKLARYLVEGRALARAVWETRYKITIFTAVVLTSVALIGALMYLIEGPGNGFDSVPRGMYWAIVTLTTVGFGDLVPQTWLGQTFASVVMVLGYGIIAVPTGIVTVALSRAEPVSTQACPQCGHEGHDVDARHCKYCGAAL